MICISQKPIYLYKHKSITNNYLITFFIYINTQMILEDQDATVSVIQDLLFQQMKALIGANKNQVQKSKDQSPFLSNLHSIEYENHILSQYHMIAKQNEFLQQIRSEIAKKKTTQNHQILFYGTSSNTMDILPMESSFDMSNISGVQAYDDEPFKTKFGEQFEKSLLSSSLNEVQENCSLETYEVIRNCVLSSKQRQFEILSQKNEKLTKKHEELQTTFIIKSTQLAQMQMQMKEALIRIQQFDQEKKKLKAKSNQLSQKEKRVYKLQTSIVFKEKLFHEGKKRYEREKSLFISIQDRLNKLYVKMQSIWEQILKKMEESTKAGCLANCQTNEETGNCWKKQVMRKCKQQLIDQRNLIKQEEQQIQQQFQMIQLLSDQVKKLINEKEMTLNIDPFTSEPSSIIFDSK